jgi:hypothetical protein
MRYGRKRLTQICGARAKSTGQPCRCKMLNPKNGRCHYHGGPSTGPRTPEGKAKSALNLPQNRKKNEQAASTEA